MARIQMVVFDIDGREFGIDAKLVNGIMRANKVSIQTVPSSSDAIEGMINWRGKVSYVLNLRKKFKLDRQSFAEERKIMMAYANDSIVGFLVDEVTDIITFNSEEIEPAPSFIQQSLNQCITGIGKIEDRLVVMLDLDKILVSGEVDSALLGSLIVSS
ncbi:chemotaxis protein CheW [Sporomusa malonica]|uniref:Purine-binding chemotaxis protein CheW n=1 Tax=Sporomusa malonica TaxID=112901 RepID=A0A1W1YFK7_9FIRM|nr:chemotaxis protein CheW [Sporomusa malonica]SMC34914.1 purine-binding chemotaxis protein CheW [Sporomusa malonica]